jgi:hypothetical protein
MYGQGDEDALILPATVRQRQPILKVNPLKTSRNQSTS